MSNTSPSTAPGASTETVRADLSGPAPALSRGGPGIAALVPALVLMVFGLAFTFRFPEPPFFGGDAQHYWQLGTTFFKDGTFSLFGSEPTFRGYLLPLILGTLNRVAGALGLNPFHIFYVLNVVLTSLAICVLIPAFLRRVFGLETTMLRIAAFAAFFVLFWRGYFLYPLTDTYSLFAVILSIVLLLMANARAGAAAFGIAAIAGMAIAAAINLRPVYLLCLPAFLIAFPLISGRLDRAALLRVAGALLGIVVILAPQAALNLRFLGTLNPFVHTGSLYILQLFFGLTVQRHECAYFVDSVGSEIVKRAGIDVFRPEADGTVLFRLDVTGLSIRDYVNVFLTYPLDLILKYVRSVANGITLLGSNIYECPIGGARYFVNIASAASVNLGIALTVVARPALLRRRYWLLLAILLLPVLFVVPTAMEGRFFLPVHVWAYAALCFVLPALAFRPRIRASVIGLSLSWVVITLLVVTLVAGTFASTYQWLGVSGDGIRLRPTVVLMRSL